MRKKIIITAVVLCLIIATYLLFTLNYSTLPSRAYDFIMRSELRPVLAQDIEELNSNLELIAEVLDSASPECGTVLEFSKKFTELKSKQKGKFMFQLDRVKKETILLYQNILTHQDCKYNPVMIDDLERFKVNGERLLVNFTSLNKNNLVRIKNNGDKEVQPVLIINGIDNSNLKTIASRLTLGDLTDQEKALRIWNFVKNHKYQANNPTKYVARDSIDLIHSWGYGNCGVATRAIVDLARLSGLQAREHRLGSHIVSEIYYNGAWHVFDADGKVYYKKNDGTFASVEDIESDLSLLSKASSEVYPQEYLEKAYQTKENNVVFNYVAKNINKEVRYILRPSESIIFLDDSNNRYFSGANYQEPEEYSNSYFVYEPKNYEKIISFTYPYPIVAGILTGKSDQTSIYFSSNLAQWQKIYSGSGEFQIDLTKFFTNGYGTPDNNYHLFFTKHASSLKMVTEVQISSKSLPLLQTGPNIIELIDNFDYDNQEIDLEFGFSSNAAKAS